MVGVGVWLAVLGFPSVRLPGSLGQALQVMVGILVGLRISRDALGSGARATFPAAVLAAGFLLSGLLAAVAAVWLTGVTPTTALFAAAPGNPGRQPVSGPAAPRRRSKRLRGYRAHRRSAAEPPDKRETDPDRRRRRSRGRARPGPDAAAGGRCRRGPAGVGRGEGLRPGWGAGEGGRPARPDRGRPHHKPRPVGRVFRDPRAARGR